MAGNAHVEKFVKLMEEDPEKVRDLSISSHFLRLTQQVNIVSEVV